ncbi:MAG: RDD family protein [Chitinophagales bacterium]
MTKIAFKSQKQTSIKYAQIWQRLAAYFIDVFCLGLFPVVLLLPTLMPVIDYETVSMKQAITKIVWGLANPYIVLFFVHWLYFSILESSKYNATLGKLLVGIKITDQKQQTISFRQANLRYFYKIISHLTFGFGFTWVFFNEKRLTLHDKWAKTIVVQSSRKKT